MHLLELEQLCAGYGRRELISGLTFTLEQGKVGGILGVNGCGKTTLFRAITVSGAWAKGQCRVNGTDVLNISPKQRASMVSLLPQSLKGPSGLLVEEILLMAFYPKLSMLQKVTSEMVRQMTEVMKEYGIYELAHQPYERLSQGQKQMVLYVRMILQDCPLMLLDEPDSALDFEHRHQMFHRLREYVQTSGKAALIIVHDPGTAFTYCDQVMLLKDGKLVETIMPQEEKESVIETKLKILYEHCEVIKRNKTVFVGYRTNLHKG